MFLSSATPRCRGRYTITTIIIIIIIIIIRPIININSATTFNTLRTGDADLRF